MNPVVVLWKHKICCHFWSLYFWRWWCRSADVLAGDGDLRAVGGGLGGDVEGTEYLPPRMFSTQLLICHCWLSYNKRIYSTLPLQCIEIALYEINFVFWMESNKSIYFTLFAKTLKQRNIATSRLRLVKGGVVFWETPGSFHRYKTHKHLEIFRCPGNFQELKKTEAPGNFKGPWKFPGLLEISRGYLISHWTSSDPNPYHF